MCHRSISYEDQANQLPEIKELLPDYAEIGAHVLQNTLRRLDKAFAAFFRRVKHGQTPGFPRYKSRRSFDSFTYPDRAGWKLDANVLTLRGIGTLKVKLHRELSGKIKTVTIKREGEHWYACFCCESEQDVTPIDIVNEVGIDVGLEKFATLSSGDTIANPRYFRLSADRLVVRQQALARCVRGSKRRDKVRSLVASLHRKVRNQRHDFLHQQSIRLVREYDAIYVEDLAIKNMVRKPKPRKGDTEAGEPEYLPNGARAKAGLDKSINDAGWGTFLQMLKDFAENAGKLLLRINPRDTSQRCSGCGALVAKELDERIHSCSSCGLRLDRDHNAAINILRLGSSQRELTAEYRLT